MVSVSCKALRLKIWEQPSEGAAPSTAMPFRTFPVIPKLHILLRSVYPPAKTVHSKPQLPLPSHHSPPPPPGPRPVYPTVLPVTENSAESC